MNQKVCDRRIRSMWWAFLLLPCGTRPLLALPAERALPVLRDGTTVAGPGTFRHEGTLYVAGMISLKNMTLELSGPIVVAAGAHLKLTHVQLRISDQPGASNGTSGLKCLGPASIDVHDSSMTPIESAHPMWSIQGRLDVDGFDAFNSEFHLQHTIAKIEHLKIFEFEASHESQVTADDLDVVFLSSHTARGEALRFTDIPTRTLFSRKLDLGSNATADLKNARIAMFLIYVEGESKVELANMGRVQIAVSVTCRGSLILPSGRLGTTTTPVVIPNAGTSDCPFRLSLSNVNVDSWDVYASGEANLRLTNSTIDELVASDHARIEVSRSSLFADWLALADDAHLSVRESTVGSLRLVAKRPDLATSQVRLTGRSRATFAHDRFDCGIYARDNAHATLISSVAPPRYSRQIGGGRITEVKRSSQAH